MAKANQRKINCALFNSKIRDLSKKKHEARRLLSSIELKPPFKETPILADILF